LQKFASNIAVIRVPQSRLRAEESVQAHPVGSGTREAELTRQVPAAGGRGSGDGAGGQRQQPAVSL